MGKQHLKRLAAPQTWPIARKKTIFVSRPRPGAHHFDYCLPISLVLTEILDLTKNSKEVKRILQSKSIFVNMKNPGSVKSQFGYMDTLHIPAQKAAYRMLLNTRGKLTLVQIPESEANVTVLRVNKKTTLDKNRTQLAFDNGLTMIVKDAKNYRIGDSVVFDLSSKKITTHIPLQKDAFCQVLSGANRGDMGVIESIEGRVVRVKGSKKVFETIKSNTFVLGEKKPMITIESKS